MTPEEALAAIAARNPALGAFVAVDPAARGGSGTLAGVPVGIKDLVDVRGLPTRCGSARFAGVGPAEADAPAVARWRDAGAAIVGKTHTHELAYGPTGDRSAAGPCRHPLDPDRMTGGSSSGSACAVAAGLVPLALGTDTGGSVRIPAALCGVVGWKLAHGEAPLDAVLPLAPTLDALGVLAADLGLAARGLEVLRGRALAPPGRVRVGWSAVPGGLVADAVRAAAEAVLGALPDVAFPLAAIGAETLAVQGAEAHAQHRDALLADPDAFGEEVRERLRAAAEVPGWAYVRALRARAAWRADPAALLGAVDVVALPTTSLVAPPLQARALPGGERVPEHLLRWTRPFNLLGWSAISLPVARVDGLPVGLQLAAPTADAVWAAARRFGP